MNQEYGFFCFMSKEAEENFKNCDPVVKKHVAHILAENIADTMQELIAESEKMGLYD